MRVRALDINGDWTYGKGQNNYKTKNNAIAQQIQSNLLSFLGDCCFDVGAGLDWFTFLGSKNQLAMNLAISAAILNTKGVTGLNQLSIDLDHVTRKLTIRYNVTTTYSTIIGTFQYDLNGAA